MPSTTNVSFLFSFFLSREEKDSARFRKFYRSFVFNVRHFSVLERAAKERKRSKRSILPFFPSFVLGWFFRVAQTRYSPVIPGKGERTGRRAARSG